MTNLAEDLLLLALDDEEGTISSETSMYLQFGLVAALLADLVLAERIDLDGKQVVVRDDTPTGDPELDEVVRTLRSSRKRHDMNHWVQALPDKIKHLQKRLTDRLIAAGILRREPGKILFVFPTTHYPAVDTTTEATIRARIRDIVLHDAPTDPRTTLLISLIHACRLTDTLFTKEERKAARARVKAIAEDKALAKAVGNAAEAVAAAYAIAVLIPAMAASSSHS